MGFEWIRHCVKLYGDIAQKMPNLAMNQGNRTKNRMNIGAAGPARGKGREASASKDFHAIALQQVPSGTGNDTANHRNRSQRLAIRAW
jgi:hypothetical protein